MFQSGLIDTRLHIMVSCMIYSDVLDSAAASVPSAEQDFSGLYVHVANDDASQKKG